MKTVLLVLLITLASFSLKAQNNDNKNRGGLGVSIGAAVNYYYGPGDQNFGKFQNERVNWQLNGMVGFTLARDRDERRTMIAAFGAFGFNNDNTVSQIFSDQGYVGSAINQSTTNNFYQLEGGLLIADILRLSTGIGQQNFATQTLASTNNGIMVNAKSLQYNSSTVGFNFNLGAIVLNVNANFNYGKDYTKTVIIPSAGLMFKF